MSLSNLEIVDEMDSTTVPVPKKERILDLDNIGLWLVIWDIAFGLPISYLIALLNKSLLTLFGYEKLMRCPSGIFVNRMLMVFVNLWLVVGWAVQLIEEERGKRIKARWEEIERWKGIVRELERERERWYELEQKQIEEQLTPRQPAKHGADMRVLEIEERVDSMIKKRTAVSPSKSKNVINLQLGNESIKVTNLVSPSRSKIPTPNRIKVQYQGDEDVDTPKANQMSEAELARKFNAQRVAMARGKIIPGLWEV